MNILVPDSWLREFLITKATPKELKDCLSLCGPSIERINKIEDDLVYDIEITSNRVDMASVYGIAREAAAILPRFGIKAELKPFSATAPIKPQTTLPMEIVDNQNLCKRILAVVMEVDQMKPSPNLVKTRLEKSGVRSLNNLVDITNYVMLEIGHPCHVFDYDRIKTHRFIIRNARMDEEIITLDNKKYLLNTQDVVIDDGTGRVIDLPGIMGTENSVVVEKTRRILFFIESNNPMAIRKTSMRYGIRTMAAAINEKNPDPLLAKTALLYGASLFAKWAEGKIRSEIIDIYPNPKPIQPLNVSVEFINQRLGITLSKKEIVSILESLDFSVSELEQKISVKPPSYRQFDIQIPEDLVEEVARIYGYHNLPNNLMQGRIPVSQKPKDLSLEEKAKAILKYLGLTEIYTYSMTSSDILKRTSISLKGLVKIANPLTEELIFMRPVLFPQMLDAISKNLKIQNSLSFFELSKTYQQQENDLPVEDVELCAATTDSFFKLKGILEVLFAELGIKNWEIKPANSTCFNNLQSGEIKIGETVVGNIGMVKNSLLSSFEISQKLSLLNLSFTKVIPFINMQKIYQNIPQFPSLTQDLALVAKPQTYISDLIKTIYSVDPLIKEVFLLDQYKNIKTVRVVYQSPNRTLTENEIRPIREKILKNLFVKFQASLKT